MSSESRDLLERLLKEAASSSTPGALSDAAADGGHPDAEQIEALNAGTLAAEVAQPLRRHILFCPVCSTRSTERGDPSGDREGAASASSKVARTAAAAVVPVAARRRLIAMLVALGIALAAAAGYVVVKATEDRDEAEEEDFSALEVLLEVNSIGPDGASRRGELLIDSAVFLELVDRLGDEEQFVYVMMVDGSGQMHLLSPQSGAARPRRLDRRVRLPGPDESWNLADWAPLAVGDEVAFLVLVSPLRIGPLEGEISRLITLPGLSEDLAAIWPLEGESGLDDLIKRIRAFGLGGRLRGLRARVRL